LTAETLTSRQAAGSRSSAPGGATAPRRRGVQFAAGRFYASVGSEEVYYAPPVRAAPLVAGVVATVIAAGLAFQTLVFTDDDAVVAYGLAAAAIAAPLFGGIAASSRGGRWTPLAIGCGIAIVAIIVLLAFAGDGES
jgi:hypothetical protein